MFTVALIGPDGAGKTTIARRLEHTLPWPAKCIYMGVNADSSNHMLPTTRLVRAIKRHRHLRPDRSGPREHGSIESRPTGIVRRLLGGVKSSINLLNLVAEEWFRLAVISYYQHRRYLVLLDRHYFADYYAYDIAKTSRRRPLTRRIHGFLLAHLYRKPDLVIYLDARPDVLLARKGEGTLRLLQRRREDYMQLRSLVPAFVVVDANRALEDVVREVSEQIAQFDKTRIANTMGAFDASKTAL